MIKQINHKVLLLIATSSLLVLTVGFLTDLRYSDEIFHWCFAKEWFERGSRPVYNELVDTVEEFHYFRYYINAPLWHLGLSNLMLALGPSKALGQMYQVFFFALLGLGTYLLARELYGEEQGWWALILVLSTPLFLAFGVLFFIDLPIASLSPFLLLTLKRDRPFFCGLILGAMFLMKRNSYLLVPALVLLVLTRSEYCIKNKVKDLFIIVAVAVLVNIPDITFRQENFGGIIWAGDKGSISLAFTPPPSSPSPFYHVSEIHSTESVTIPSNILKFLGLVLPLGFLFSLARYYRQLGRDDLWVLLLICLYIPLYLYFFKFFLAVRWLSPIFPFLAVFASKGIKGLGDNKVFKTLLITLCIAQMLSVLGYVSSERRISEAEREGLSYINFQIPEGARVLTPEELFISYYTGRPTLWYTSFGTEKFSKLLWGGNTEAVDLLHKYQIKYIIVQQYRVYNDSSVRHYGGFPSSFVEKRLPVLAQKVWENEVMAIWATK